MVSIAHQTASQIVDPVETRFEHVSVGVPDYDKFQTSTIATGKRGRAPGELTISTSCSY